MTTLKTCDRCEGNPAEWSNIDGKDLCQECWEEHCAEQWQLTGLGRYEPVESK